MLQSYYGALATSIILVVVSCGGDPSEPNPPPPGPPPPDPITVVETASAVAGSDAGEAGNAGDLEVSFTKAADETGIAEYRIIVVKSSVSSFDLAAAAALSAASYVSVTPNGSDVRRRLSSQTTDSDGATIISGVAYTAVVLSVADGTTRITNALSAPSAAVTLNTTAPVTLRIELDDPRNNGDASDLVIGFDPAADEGKIDQYRVFLVKEASQAGFDLSAAQGLAADRFVVAQKTGGYQRVSPSAATLDSDGNAITVGEAYVAFILSEADGSTANIDALSSASNTITVANTTVKITAVGNAGVLIEDDQFKVLVDGVYGNLSGWVQMSGSELQRLTTGTAPYDGVDVVLATHNHGDHFAPTSAATVLGAHPGALLIGPPQAVSTMSSQNQVVQISPAFHQRAETTVNGVRIEILHLTHFDQFGNDFSGVENYAYIIHLGGKKILHMGDVDYAVSNLSAFGLDQEGIDIVLIPTFNTLISTANRDAIVGNINPANVVGLHFLVSQMSSDSTQTATLFPGAVLFTRAPSSVRY